MTERRAAPMRLLRAIAIAGVLGLLGLLVWDLVKGETGTTLVNAVAAGKRPAAPPFDLPVVWPQAVTWPHERRSALDDGRVRLEELRGTPVVINFWASWCVPCREEAPRFATAARRHAGRIAFLGIDIQDFKSDARRFLRKYRVNYVSVRDGTDSTAGRYGLTGVPETYFLDRQGRILVHSVGAVSTPELERGIGRIAQQT